MGQATFTFKKFTIKQDQCAMKVSTDACVFGAWAAQKIYHLNLPCPRILDIGTGTGLLSLMTAQQLTKFDITAIEIDWAAAMQAKENIEKSPWNTSIHLIHADIKNYFDHKCFDIIISNPPFFERDLPANSPAKNQAFHDSSLTLADLMMASRTLLKTMGHLYLILPASRKNDLERSCESLDFVVTACCSIKPSEYKSVSRILVECRKRVEANTTVRDDSLLVIQGQHNGYSEDASKLLKDYYLNL